MLPPPTIVIFAATFPSLESKFLTSASGNDIWEEPLGGSVPFREGPITVGHERMDRNSKTGTAKAQ